MTYNEHIGIDRETPREKRETRGEFDADEFLAAGLEMIEEGRHEAGVRRGQQLVQQAGMIAAREARFNGVIINGWEEKRPIVRDVWIDEVLYHTIR